MNVKAGKLTMVRKTAVKDEVKSSSLPSMNTLEKVLDEIISMK